MKVIVITGSTKGIGRGLSEVFLSLGCKVAIASRRETAVNQAVNHLSKTYGAENVFGHVCDVTKMSDVQALWDTIFQKFGKIDIWINNAGQANLLKKFWELDSEDIQSVVSTNIRGTMYGSKVAITEMIKQGHGALYNFLGFGSNGMKINGLALYGTTKYALRYFTDCLKKEVKGTHVIVGSISPGMVATDMLLGEYRSNPQALKKAKRIFNILADYVETVTPYIARKVLSNTKNGIDIAWLTKAKIFWRFLSSPFHKRNIIK